jgi:hypothetical protein
LTGTILQGKIAAVFGDLPTAFRATMVNPAVLFRVTLRHTCPRCEDGLVPGRPGFHAVALFGVRVSYRTCYACRWTGLSVMLASRAPSDPLAPKRRLIRPVK